MEVTEEQDNELENRKMELSRLNKEKKNWKEKNLQSLRDLSDKTEKHTIYVTEEPEREEKNSVQRKSFWRECIWGKFSIFGEIHKHTNSRS